MAALTGVKMSFDHVAEAEGRDSQDDLVELGDRSTITCVPGACRVPSNPWGSDPSDLGVPEAPPAPEGGGPGMTCSVMHGRLKLR